MRLLLISLLMLSFSCSAWSVENRYLYPLTHVKNVQAFSIAEDTNLVYTRNQNQILVFSIFNAWQPRIETGFTSLFSIEDAEMQAGKYLYVASREPSNQLIPIDTLATSGKIFFPSTVIGDKLTREGATLYIADRYRGIDIVNIGSGARDLLSTFSEKWGIRDFVATHPYIFALNDFGLVAVDISDQKNPKAIATNYQIADATCLVKNGNTLWVGAGKNLLAFNIYDPANPKLINQFRLANEIATLKVKDNLLYLALGRGGVKILGIANPLKIEDINTINTNFTVYDLTLANDYIFIALGKDGWMIYEYR
ncbi:MAG: hypothetical protein PHY48_07115 [Candidatus Cloacimonetes bacterium]|nr:hypothetical protein [Candidatus Cloacimonadota bacterium]